MAGTWKLAARNVTRNTRRSVLAASAVFFGVLALLVVRGTLNGIQRAMRDALVERHTGALQVHRAGYLKQVVGTPLSLRLPAASTVAAVQAVPGVRAASARVLFGGMLNANDITTLAVFTAFDPVDEYRVCPHRTRDFTTGRALEPGAPLEVVAASALARRLSWTDQPGAVLSADVDGVLNAADVRLVGTVGLPNVPGLEARTAWMALSSAQEMLRMPGEATEVAVAVHEIRDLETMRDRVAAALGPNFEVHTWEDLAPAVKGDQRNQEVIFGVMVAVFLLAALVGITNTLLVGVLERTREIGTMLAVGARRRRILQLFLAEGALLGLLGAVAGLVGGGLAVALLNHRGLHLKAVGGGLLHVYPFLDVVQTAALVAVCCLGAVLASVYPAWKAARLTPVQAMAGTGSA